MIIFHKVRAKNFLAIGNRFIEIVLDQHPTTLVLGKNGSGKSTILDMILFGLFGYPLRNINLNQIVNSINKKDCIVEIEFSTRGHRYLIRRGLAPNCFVIFKDGEEIIQEAKTKDYQNMLEEKVLQVDYETFRQVVVLGSASYVPFMRLKSTERKEIIEDLLNIKIFSEMAAILKTKFTNLKSEIERTDSELVAITQKITMQEGYCQEAKKRKNIQTSSIDEQITEHQKTLTATIKESEECSARISELTDQIADQTYTANIKEMETLKIKLESTQERIKRDVNFIKNSDVCPTCTQKILDDFKTEFVAIREPKITQRDQAIKNIVEKIESLEAKQEEIDDYKNQLSEARSNLLGLNGKIKYISGTIGRLTEQKVKALEAQSTSDDKIEMALADFRSEKDQLETTKRGQQETRYLYEMATAMLKETGVKSKILEQYLPILNNTINHYLNRMEFLVDFNINGNFEETIKSRFRDEFSYESFSEGEKARINLALLLTWRAIATMKNSISTNLLVLDEIFDSSLDSFGSEELIKILNDLGEDKTNVMVISHRSEMATDKFSRTIKFTKMKDYTVIHENI